MPNRSSQFQYSNGTYQNMGTFMWILNYTRRKLPILSYLLLFMPFLMASTTEFLIIESLDDAQEYTKPNRGAGFFACFQSVIGALDIYEKGDYTGCSVRLEWGLYVDPTVGPNWWEYYFEPIELGIQDEHTVVKRFSKKMKEDCAYNAISTISRERAYELIQKYVLIKPHIQEKIDTFVENHFSNTYVIGVHYRGTDKCSEASLVSYAEVYNTLENIIIECKQAGHCNYKIFIATEDARFLDYMQEHSDPAYLCYYPAIRSRNGKPIHFDRSNSYRLGEEALIDCILLSKCSLLLRTQSNLSASAGNFNPQLPVISLGTLKKCATLPNVR